MKSGSSDAGREAETFALQHLQQHGLQLLARNWSCRRGELDLVMLDGSTVVFVEVRYRRQRGWGSALESVDARKQEKLIATAQLFLQQESRWADSPCRFDVVAVDGEPENGAALNWLQSAFDT